jgi:hypothetical protein
VTFDEALAAVLALVGRRVEIHVFDASESPHLVATFGGSLRAGYSTTGGEPNERESIFVRLDCGEEEGALLFDRQLYDAAMQHDDGSITIRFGQTELLVAPRLGADPVRPGSQ